MLKDPVTSALRRVFEQAEEEARARGSELLRPEHLLLALIGETEEPAGAVLPEAGVSAESLERELEAPEAEALAALGISLEDVRGRAEEAFGADAWTEATRHSGKVRRSGETAAAVERAAGEAWALGDQHFGTEHLLLGLIGHGGALGGALSPLGVSPLVLRERLLERLGGATNSGTPPTDN